MCREHENSKNKYMTKKGSYEEIKTLIIIYNILIIIVAKNVVV